MSKKYKARNTTSIYFITLTMIDWILCMAMPILQVISRWYLRINKYYKKTNMINKNNMERSLKFSFILIFCFLTFNIFSQSARKTTNTVAGYMEAVRTEQARPKIDELLINAGSHIKLLEAVSPYFTDSLVKVRLAAYQLTYDVGISSNELSVRQRAVGTIVSGLRDRSGTITGWSARHLNVFNRSDFDEQAKSNIVNAMSSVSTRLNELIKIAGYLNLESASSQIEGYALNAARVSDKWAAYLALSRMGREDYTSKVVVSVRKHKMNDDVIYELVPDLIYTRQKACVDYVIEVLYSDQKNCISSNPDNPVAILCAYRVLEYLAPVIKDFPLAVKASGDIDTDDYNKALKTAREWFLQKGDSYEIMDNSY